jgi:anti-sigma-K factor RskA
MSCATVDELAAAYALGGVDADEERAISEHLDTCGEPHTEARDLLGAAPLVGVTSQAITPRPQLRERLMATASATPQDHRPVLATGVEVRRDVAPAPTWWRRVLSPGALAAVAMAAAIGLGAWNIGLSRAVAERDQAIRAIASADAVYQVTGSAGSGLLLDTGGDAIFVADGLADLPGGSLYELWLIGADGAPVAVGTVSDTNGVAVVTLERPLGDATAFAITVESSRVDAPTTDPVLTATIEG